MPPVQSQQLTELLELSALERRRRAERDLGQYLLAAPINLLFGRSKLDVVRRAARAYLDLKRQAQERVGLFMVLPLRGGRGDDICRRYEYCRRRADFIAVLEAAQPEVILAARQSDIVDWIVELTGELMEQVGDSVLPLSFLLLSLRYGLDDLCRCCKTCGGSGSTNGQTCEACLGSGIAIDKPPN